MNIGRNYKFGLNIPYFKDRTAVRVINDEDDNIIPSFFNELEKFDESFSTGDYSIQKKQFKQLCNFISDHKIPFDELIVQSEIIDFCLDKYERSNQDSDFGEIGLKILYSFAHSDSQYLNILIERGFLEVCQKFVFIGYPTFFPIEIDILNCLISNPETCRSLIKFDITKLFSRYKNFISHQNQRPFYMFLSKYFKFFSINEGIVIECFKLFKLIKEKGFASNYDLYDTIYWSEILFHLINSKYFDVDVFFDTALYIFYEQNYNNYDHIPFLGQFYSLFILKYPKFRTVISFDFLYYINLIQHDKSNEDLEPENEKSIENIKAEEDIRSVAYNTLAFYLQVFHDQEQIDIQEGISNGINFNEFILQIPDDFIQNQIIDQVHSDYDNGTYIIKINSLFFLSTFVIVRPDAILKCLKVADYVDLYIDFIQTAIFDSVLLSFESIYGEISKYPEFKEICQEINETEMYQSLSQMVDDDEFNQDTLKCIQRFLNNFSGQ